MVSGVLARNTNPKLRAAVTKAPSSGDWAWYTSSPGTESRGQISKRIQDIEQSNFALLCRISDYKASQKASKNLLQRTRGDEHLMEKEYDVVAFTPVTFTPLLRHDCVAQSEQSEKFLNQRLLQLNGLHQAAVMETELPVQQRVEGEIHTWCFLGSEKQRCDSAALHQFPI